MDKFLIGPIRCELGYEILVARPQILAAISRLKKENKNNEVTVFGANGKGVLYQNADKFIPFGTHIDTFGKAIHSSFFSKICNPKDYTQVDYSKETITDSNYVIPHLKKEWFEKANEIVQGEYVSVSIRYRREEGGRNFPCWDRIISKLKSEGKNIICTSPNNLPTKIDVPYLEDFIGKVNDDSMGIEMCIHSKAKLCITTNTGSAGIILLSNPDKFLIFGGTTGFYPNWDGLHKILLSKNGYKTKLIVLGGYNGLALTKDIEKGNELADKISKIAITEIKEK